MEDYFVAEKSNMNGTDLSININPLGMPAGIKKAIMDSIGIWSCYPDDKCKSLSSSIAVNRKVKTEQVLCVNGADDAIYRIAYALKPKKALLLAPTYEDYENALQQVGCEITYYYLKSENNFEIEHSLLAQLDQSVDVFFLCNPNNPTGQVVEPQMLKEILEVCKSNHIMLIVDECFNGFLDDADRYSGRQFIERYSNLIIIEAFTKLYAMSGLRLGFCLSSNKQVLKDIFCAGQPWSVSIPAQVAGIVALEDKKYLQETARIIKIEKSWMLEQLNQLGIEVLGASANFLFFKSPINGLREILEKKNVYIRNCEKFKGLNTEYCRIAIRMHEDNKIFIEALKKVINVLI
jgi:threonine-phosphate decarboxylase